MIAHLARAGLPEVIGWAVVITALLVLLARAVVDGPEYLNGRLHATVGRLRRPVLLRAARLRRRHRTRQQAQEAAAGAHRAHRRVHPTRTTIPGGTAR